MWAAAARAPAALYRIGLGWVLGNRLLMVVHRGRRTGRLRHTVVEVARFDQARDEYTVVAAFGRETDWYQNVMAQPAVAVHVGCRHFVPDQRVLSVGEADDVLARYAREHSRLFPLLLRVVGLTYDGSSSRRRALAEAMPMIAFRPRARRDQRVRQKADTTARRANSRKNGR